MGAIALFFLTLFNTIPVQATAYMAAPKEAVGFDKWHVYVGDGLHLILKRGWHFRRWV